MSAPRAVLSQAHKFLASAKPPDLGRILPPEAVFASAQKSGFLKCNRAEATKVLTEVWKTTQEQRQQQQGPSAAAVARICAAHSFSPSNFASLALLLQPLPNTAPITTDLLTLGEILNDPAAILKSARSKLSPSSSSSRSLTLLKSSAIWKRLEKLAEEQQVPEAYELLAETHQNAKSTLQAQEYWTKAAAAGSGKACMLMGRKAAVMGKADVAVEAFKRAAELGEAEAYYELGVLQVEKGGNVKDGEHSLSVAAASGVVGAAVRLAELYRSRGEVEMGELWEAVAGEMKTL